VAFRWSCCPGQTAEREDRALSAVKRNVSEIPEWIMARRCRYFKYGELPLEVIFSVNLEVLKWINVAILLY